MMAQQLYKAGADINAQDDSGYSALMYACMANNSAVVQYLLKQKCSVNTQQEVQCLPQRQHYYIFRMDGLH